jgi:Spy/CpxP family protein refolding chaperone
MDEKMNAILTPEQAAKWRKSEQMKEKTAQTYQKNKDAGME